MTSVVGMGCCSSAETMVEILPPGATARSRPSLAKLPSGWSGRGASSTHVSETFRGTSGRSLRKTTIVRRTAIATPCDSSWTFTG